MKQQTIKTISRVLLIFFAIAMLLDGFAGILRESTGQEVMRHLGYPVYALSIFGIAKVLGALAIVQSRFTTLREWAFAGFTINFIGAALSRAYAGDGFGLIIPPLIMLAFMFLVYFLLKQAAGQTEKVWKSSLA